MHRKPDRDWFSRGGFHPVLAVGVDHQPIPRREMRRLLRILKPDLGLSLQNENPFVRGLVKPEAWWRDLSRGKDAFDAE